MLKEMGDTERLCAQEPHWVLLGDAIVHLCFSPVFSSRHVTYDALTSSHSI